MTNTENKSATLQQRAYDALEELQGGRYHLAPLVRTAVAELLASSLLPQIRVEAINEAMEAARGEHFAVPTDTAKDVAYSEGVSSAVAAIAALLLESK
jgi:hypothetical protein